MLAASAPVGHVMSMSSTWDDYKKTMTLPATLQSAAKENDVARTSLQSPLPGPGAKLLARPSTDRMHRPGDVDPKQIVTIRHIFS